MTKLTSQTDSESLDPIWGEYSSFHDPRILANFVPRSSDVLITTAPKSGTTWMQQILHQLRSGGDDSFNAINDVVPWLEKPNEQQDWQLRLKHFDNLTNPRIFKTHCTAEQTPGIDAAKIILSSRDPRDCCISMYHHIMNMTDEVRTKTNMPLPTSFDEHVDQWLEFAAWYRNIESWWPYQKHPNVLWLRYQDMKQDLNACMQQIIDFLGWQVNPEQQAKALEYSSFAWMKQHDEKFSRQDAVSKPFFKPGKFIREGNVGAHKTEMSAKQGKRILDKAKQELEAECLRFLEL